MKLSIILMFFCCCGLEVVAQNRHLFRLYEDNDFINIVGKGTDKGYTNGTELAYFFRKKKASRFFMDNWLPKAGKKAINTFSYNLSQLMFVSKDISRPEPDKNDWPYAGALFLTHSLHSSNAIKKFSLHTEIVGGVIGPLSLAKETQTFIHRLIGDTKPMGWHYQMPNDILLNINLLAEKMLWQNEKSLELIGGGQVQVGTMLDGASLHIQLRLGHMQPYFNGYLEKYSSIKNQNRQRLQYYLFIKPSLKFLAYNALVNGGVFNEKATTIHT